MESEKKKVGGTKKKAEMRDGKKQKKERSRVEAKRREG
jgi:hypothetical protein